LSRVWTKKASGLLLHVPRMPTLLLQQTVGRARRNSGKTGTPACRFACQRASAAAITRSSCAASVRASNRAVPASVSLRVNARCMSPRLRSRRCRTRACRSEAVAVARALARARVLTFSETPARASNYTAARSRSRDRQRSRLEPRAKRFTPPPAPTLDATPPISPRVVSSEHTSPQTTAAPCASLVPAAPRPPLQRPAKGPTPDTIARLDAVLDCLGPSS
jgi:hypothetical protein